MGALGGLAGGGAGGAGGIGGALAGLAGGGGGNPAGGGGGLLNMASQFFGERGMKVKLMKKGGVVYAEGGVNIPEGEEMEVSIAPQAKRPLENVLFGEREELTDREGKMVGEVFEPSKLRKLFGGPDVKASFRDGGYVSAAGGVKLMKKVMDEGGESDPPRADFLMSYQSGEGEGDTDLSFAEKQARMFPGMLIPAGTTASPAGDGLTLDAEGNFVLDPRTAVESTATGINTAFIPTGAPEPESPEESPRYVPPIAPRLAGPLPNPYEVKIIKRGDGETPEPVTPSDDMHRIAVGDFFTNKMVFRDYDGSKERIGQQEHEGSGDKRDLFSFGLKTKDGKDKFASREVFQMMQDEGIDPYSPYADEFMRDLYKSNPDLFGDDYETARRMMTEMVQNDPALRQAGQEGFFFPSQGLTPEQKGALQREQNVQGVQALKRNRSKYGQR